MCTLAVQPSYAEIGLWISIVFFMIPAVKVIVDWIRPPKHVLEQPISVSMEKQFATKAELEKLERDLTEQMKDMRSYVHQEIHKLRGDLQSSWQSSDSAREGIHNRINAAVEVLYEMRGSVDILRERLDRK